MDSNTKDAVKQTSKTILFQRFTYGPDALSLKGLLDLYDDPTKALIDHDLEKLEVRSFEEFLSKFKPKIYEICDYNDGIPVFTYTINQDEARKRNGVEQDIATNTFYRMIMQMYETKGKSGISNLNFDDSGILEMLHPKQEIKDAKNIRNLLQLSYKKYCEAQDRAEKDAMNEYAKKFVVCREKIKQKYKDSKLGLLPLAIEDVNAKLKYLTNHNNLIESGEVINPTGLITGGKLDYDDNGNLIVVPVVNGSVELVEAPKTHVSIAGVLSQRLATDYEQVSGENSNKFVKDLIVSTYALEEAFSNGGILADEVKEKIEEYTNRKNDYENVYTQAKNSFIEALADICSKLLSVKVFFDHATAEGGNTGKLEASGGLIVANCEVNELIDSNTVDKFKKFIKHRGKDQTSQKIWFAIIPGVVQDGYVSEDVFVDPLADLVDREHEDNKKKSKGDRELTVSELKEILSYLNESKIMTIFSYKGNKDNGFDAMSVDFIEDAKKTLGSINNPHAVFAYPNFTVMRSRDMSVSESEFGVAKIALPAIYVEACFAAAGLIVGSQQVEYLRAYGYKNKVLNENVCVRVDLEETKTDILTKFNRELGTRWSQDIKTKINEDMFGFVFCSDEIRVQDRMIDNTYIYCARTLKKSKNVYRPLYRVLTEDFVYVYLNTLPPNKKIKDIKDFISKDVAQWSVLCKQKEKKDSINLILREGEDITFNDEEQKIEISFNGDSQILDDIEVISD